MRVIGKPDAKRQTYAYTLGYNNTQVCKKTFMDTFDIGAGILKGINKRRCKDTGNIKPTMRGKSELNNN